MLFLLAQAVAEKIPPEDVGTYEAVKEGVRSGIESTASSRPSEWLMVMLSLIITYFFLRQQRAQQEEFSKVITEKERVAEKKDSLVVEAVEAMNTTILAVQTKFTEEAKVAQKECHGNALALRDGQGVLHEIAHDIKDAVVGIREQTASQERIAATTRETLHGLKNTLNQLNLNVEVQKALREHNEGHIESLVIIDPPAQTKTKDTNNAS
jgi:hypothetical protein